GPKAFQLALTRRQESSPITRLKNRSPERARMCVRSCPRAPMCRATFRIVSQRSPACQCPPAATATVMTATVTTASATATAATGPTAKGQPAVATSTATPIPTPTTRTITPTAVATGSAAKTRKSSAGWPWSTRGCRTTSGIASQRFPAWMNGHHNGCSRTPGRT
ncbi:hypothetical protein HK405_001926, partial [Cladochytrium tenue]